jgi:hypothetical protein
MDSNTAGVIMFAIFFLAVWALWVSHFGLRIADLGNKE